MVGGPDLPGDSVRYCPLGDCWSPALVLDRNASRDHIRAMLIRTEQTPNPATRKFLPGQTVMDAGTRDFADAESAGASPLAKALFDSGMVEGVFFGRDFASVTAAPGVSWSDLDPLVVETLLDHLDRKSTRLNSSHSSISYAVFCLKK